MYNIIYLRQKASGGVGQNIFGFLVFSHIPLFLLIFVWLCLYHAASKMGGDMAGGITNLERDGYCRGKSWERSIKQT